ncbi:hypothetical protein BYT27DRAFT_6557093 [Phlegmacium glaucopus]|nr:hypothetical protein BYT27DRAFT_6557093 [Phlegmacium glaucopus]
MNSEEPIQLESSSPPVSASGHQTTLEAPPLPLVSEPTTNPELASYSHDPDLSATVEEEVGLTTVLDRTLVEGDDVDASTKEHAKGPSASSISLSSKGHAPRKSRDSHSTRHDGSNEGGSPTPWHPLHNVEVLSKGGELQGHDHNIVLVEDDVVDSKGKLLYPQTDMKTTSNRTSHLHLDLKPSSPQPWEQIDPPLDNTIKSMEDYYSPSVTQQRFHTMQKASEARPLIPKSSYYFGPPPPDSAYGTAPIGHIGVHHPREILRVERDYTGGELIQFAPIYPLELEGRITPTQFLESINAMNELLISAHTLRHSFVDNALAIFSLQISKLFMTSHFEKEMMRFRHLIDDLNTRTFNPVGLNILWPRNVAFLYLEIEYYVSNLTPPDLQWV